MAFDRRKMHFYTPAQLEAIRNPKPIKLGKHGIAMLFAMADTISMQAMSRPVPRKPRDFT